MTKEDKQIIDRAVKEEWRIGDRTRLKRLFEKNLKQYRDNVELENKNKKLESNFRICEKNADTYYTQLTKAKEIIKDLMSFPIQLCDCRHTVDFEKIREKAVQFIKEIEK